MASQLPRAFFSLSINPKTIWDEVALGERIGSVSTGLPEDSISKSLTKTVCCSLPMIPDVGSCAICLEDYNGEDDVAALRTCGHDYHVNCIKKWLSMKNVCPICRASAMPDDPQL